MGMDLDITGERLIIVAKTGEIETQIRTLNYTIQTSTEDTIKVCESENPEKAYLQLCCKCRYKDALKCYLEFKRYCTEHGYTITFGMF